eukprot:TRINITY_DN43794_c0_g1_i1.p2 TRINITY_DN43794_c0_g1~~TRINITY_DN43794_c0_g1_i1.p2  ORF type:complete len:271 (+),score=115.99 TRINITY_DN43794_c0_g1_i1:71-814(+)
MAAVQDALDAELAAAKNSFRRVCASLEVRQGESQRRREEEAQRALAAELEKGTPVERCDRMLAEAEPEVEAFLAELKGRRADAAAREREQAARQRELDELADIAERDEADRLQRLSDWEATWHAHLEAEELEAESQRAMREAAVGIEADEEMGRLGVAESADHALQEIVAEHLRRMEQRAADELWLERWLEGFEDRWQSERTAAVASGAAAVRARELQMAETAGVLEAEAGRYRAAKERIGLAGPQR